MSQNLQNFVKFQKFQLDNLVDFEKCCKTHIFLQKSEPIQPKTSNILPKFCRSAVVSQTVESAVGHRAVFSPCFSLADRIFGERKMKIKIVGSHVQLGTK